MVVFRCSECGSGFVHADELAAHVSVTHVAWVPYACALGCEHFYAPTLRLLLEHCAAEHPGVAADYACDADEDKTRRLNAILARSLWTAIDRGSVGGATHTEGVDVVMSACTPSMPPSPRLVAGSVSQQPHAESALLPTAEPCAEIDGDASVYERDVNAILARSVRTMTAVASIGAACAEVVKESARRPPSPPHVVGAALQQPVVESAAPPTAAVVPQLDKPASGDGVGSMECRLCGANANKMRRGFRMEHVCDRHVDGLVYHCSACNKAFKALQTVNKHIRLRRKHASTADGHQQAVALSNRDQLKEAVRAAYVQCFGQAAARRSRVLHGRTGSRTKGQQSLATALQKMEKPAESAASTSKAVGAIGCTAYIAVKQEVMDAQHCPDADKLQ